MILKDIRTAIRRRMGEIDDSISRWTEANAPTQLNVWINDGRKIVENYADWKFLEREISDTTVQTTTATPAVTAGGTTVTVNSTSGLRVGDYFYIYAGTVYERHKISAINFTTSVITISDTFTSAFAIGSAVAKTDYMLPHNTVRVKSVLDVTNNNPLSFIQKDDYDNAYPLVKSIGDPLKYTFGEYHSVKETGLSATTGTSTTSVVATGLKGGFNQYYYGWNLIGTGVALGESRVSAYTATTISSGTFTLENAITSMATTCTFELINDLPMLRIYPIPDSAAVLQCKFFVRNPPLVNDYDVPMWGPDGQEFHELLVEYGRARCLEDDGKTELSLAAMAIFEKKLGQMYVRFFGRPLNSSRMKFPLKGLVK